MPSSPHSLITEGVGDGVGVRVGVAVGIGVKGTGVAVGVGVIRGDKVTAGVGVGAELAHASPSTRVTVHPIGNSSQPFFTTLSSDIYDSAPVLLFKT